MAGIPKVQLAEMATNFDLQRGEMGIYVMALAVVDSQQE